MAATVSVIGAVFGEWAGAEEGLGWLVLNDNSHLETARVYAGVVVLSAMAVGAVRGRDAGRALGRAVAEGGAVRRLALLLAAAVALAGCGERKEVVDPGAPEPAKLTLLLDFFANGDHAPIYAAEAGGHFEELSLDVKIRQPTDPATPLKLLAAGKVDLAISYEPEVLRARDKGLRVVSVAALVQEPLTSLMWLPEVRHLLAGRPRGQARGHRRASTTSRPTSSRSSPRPAWTRSRWR